MNRFKAYEPRQHLLLPFDPETMFPANSFEGILVDLISELDLSNYWQSTDLGGETPFDPRSILGIIFYGIVRGVFSTRKLEEACKKDLGFMFVSGHSAPDHTTIARFITRNQDNLQEVFSQILYILNNRGLLDYSKIAIDGTKIKAYASSQFTGTMADFNKRKKGLEEKIAWAMGKLKEKLDTETHEHWEKKKEEYKKEHAKITNFLNSMKKEYNANGKECRQNITDPESRLMKSGQKYEQAYNAQIAVSGKDGFIIGIDVVNDQNDQKMLKNMVENIKDQLPENLEVDLGKSKILCDNGYVTVESIQYCADENLNVYMPTSCDKKLYKDEKISLTESGLVTTRECSFGETENEVYCICPGGKKILREKTSPECGKVYTFTAGAKKNCEGCKYFHDCRGKLSGIDKKFEANYSRIKSDEKLKAHIQKMKSDEARFIYSRRMDIVEKVFGHIKANWGFDKVLRRGLKKAQTTWAMICVVYNIKKMHKVISMRSA